MMRPYLIFSHQFLKPPQKQVKDDFMQMHHDLAKRYVKSHQLKPDLKVCGYAFSMLFDQTVQKSTLLAALRNVDMCFLIVQTPEFDPSFTHIGTYLQDYYGLTCDFVDLSEHGDFSEYVSLSLLKAYMQLKGVKKVCVLQFQQSGIVTSVKPGLSSRYANMFQGVFFEWFKDVKLN